MQDVVGSDAKRCYACIQWEGQRSFDHATKKIKVDAAGMGYCLVKHCSTKGSFACEHYFQIK